MVASKVSSSVTLHKKVVILEVTLLCASLETTMKKVQIGVSGHVWVVFLHSSIISEIH